MIEVRRIDNYTYDLFLGKQWSDWVRIKQTKSGTFRLAGMRIDHALLKWLHTILHPTMPVSYGQDLHTMLKHNKILLLR